MKGKKLVICPCTVANSTRAVHTTRCLGHGYTHFVAPIFCSSEGPLHTCQYLWEDSDMLVPPLAASSKASGASADTCSYIIIIKYTQHQALNLFTLLSINISACTLLPSNQSFYRQKTSHEKGGPISGVGLWWGTATKYKIVVTGLIGVQLTMHLMHPY